MRIITNLSGEEVEPVIAEVAKLTLESGELTPRSITTIANLNEHGFLYLAFVEKELAGWVLAEPLGPNLFELGMTYVKPRFRRLPVFKALAANAIRPEFAYVLATYSEQILEFAKREYEFKQSSLLRVIQISRGRFLLKRLGNSQRSSIAARVKHRKPLFAYRPSIGSKK